MEQPVVATAERPVSTETEVSGRDIISAVNETSDNLDFEVDVLRNHERLGHSLSTDQQKTIQDDWNFKDTRKEVLRGKDGPLPDDLKSDIHYLRFEDPKNPTGPGIIMEEGIPVEGILGYLDRTIERRSSLPAEQANLDHYQRLKQIILDNSKPLKELYFPGMSEEELDRDPAFNARLVYGARKWVWKHPEEAYDIGNWIAEEKERLLQRRELTMPVEIETDLPFREPTITKPATYKEQPLEADLPRVIWRNGIKIIWKKRGAPAETAPTLPESSPMTNPFIRVDEGESQPPIDSERVRSSREKARIPGVEERRSRETPRDTENRRGPRMADRDSSARMDLGIRGSEDDRMRVRAERLAETQFGRNLRMDRVILAALAGIVLASAVLHGGEPKQRLEFVPTPIDVSGPIYGPGKPPEPLRGLGGKGPDLQVLDFGEEGHSLNGLAVSIGAYLDNKEQVEAAKERGEVYTPDLGAKMERLGVKVLPPNDSDLIEAVQRAEKEVPWWQKWLTRFKESARTWTYDPQTFEPAIKEDSLPQKVTIPDPNYAWGNAKREHQMERGMLTDEQL